MFQKKRLAFTNPNKGSQNSDAEENYFAKGNLCRYIGNQLFWFVTVN